MDDDRYGYRYLPLVVTSAEPIRLDIQLGRAGTISGRLRNVRGEVVSEGIGVALCPAIVEPGHIACVRTYSDRSGNFEFEGVGAGTYRVTADAGRYPAEARVILEEGDRKRVELEVVPWDYEFQGAFFDDEGSFHETAIDAVAGRGLLAGTHCAAARICPREGITRAVMAVWLGRALTQQEPQPIEASRFADVEVDGRHVFEARHIDRFADLGVTRGCRTEPLRYCPDTVVTRAEMATFLQRALELDIPDEPAGFADVDADSVHARSIDALRASGITAGCSTEPLPLLPEPAGHPSRDGHLHQPVAITPRRAPREHDIPERRRDRLQRARRSDAGGGGHRTLPLRGARWRTVRGR